jgi:hypothetical protein
MESTTSSEILGAAGGELWAVIEDHPKRPEVSEERLARERRVLANLPPDFETEMRAAWEFGKQKYGKAEERNRAFKGELFESLVKADTDILPRPESKLGATLRNIMHLPDMFFLKDLGIKYKYKNPDGTLTDEQNPGKITGAIEIKSVVLDEHASEQIGSFKSNFEWIIKKLRHIKDSALKAHGLAILAENKWKLSVAEDFKVILVIPTGIYGGTAESIMDPAEEAFSTPDKRALARKRIQKCEIVESPFSRGEISRMSTYLQKKFAKSI